MFEDEWNDMHLEDEQIVQNDRSGYESDDVGRDNREPKDFEFDVEDYLGRD
jgi:hypothetical protein